MTLNLEVVDLILEVIDLILELSFFRVAMPPSSWMIALDCYCFDIIGSYCFLVSQSFSYVFFDDIPNLVTIATEN